MSIHKRTPIKSTQDIQLGQSSRKYLSLSFTEVRFLANQIAEIGDLSQNLDLVRFLANQIAEIGDLSQNLDLVRFLTNQIAEIGDLS